MVSNKTQIYLREGLKTINIDNQEDLDFANSELSSIDLCEKLIDDFTPNVIFFELHTPLNSVAENTIFSRKFVQEIKWNIIKALI